MHLSAKYAPPAATLKKDLDFTQQFVTTVWLRCHRQHQESPTAGLCLHQGQEETGPSRQGIYQGSLQEPLVQSEQQEPHDLILITNTRTPGRQAAESGYPGGEAVW